MLFNSLPFALFLPAVFVLYWSLQGRSLRAQNLLLLVASYVFYGWWDYRFLALIVVSSGVDYVVGLAIRGEARGRRRRLLLLTSLLVNLGLLGFFKYFNFFIDSFGDLLTAFGLQPNLPALRIILPVGISFYTFQTLSYTIDIYRRKIEPTRDVIAFFAFVSFFPQLVAGPIERAASLLPQFERRRRFESDAACDGVRQIAWGLFKKVVIADNLAVEVGRVFGANGSMDGISLILGVVLFAFQIYGDFSGYSDIALGTARLFGFRLMRNFAYPYFSRDIAEFWRRWHISLSSWFRDYVYIPLGGSRSALPRRMANILVTFAVSGFWHGANWTFVVWGLLNGLYYLPVMLLGRHRRYHDTAAAGRLLPGFGEAVAIGTTFVLTLVAWVFFRAESVGQAAAYLAGIVRGPFFQSSVVPHGPFVYPLLLIGGLVVVEWLQRERMHPLQVEGAPAWFRWMAYLWVSLAVIVLGNFGGVEFIYFQF